MINPEVYQSIMIVLSTAVMLYFAVVLIRMFLRDF